MSQSYPTNAPEMLAAMARMYNYDLSGFESVLWTGEIFDVYLDRDIVLALKYHMENGENSRFMPRYGDIKQILEVQDDTVQQINLLVSRYGSYSPPPESETTPVLLATIEQMGGWTKVCAEMPDAQEAFAFSQYMKRIQSASSAAKKRLSVYKQNPKPLVGRGSMLSFDVEKQPLLKNLVANKKRSDKMTSTLKVKQLTQALNPTVSP